MDGTRVSPRALGGRRSCEPRSSAANSCLYGICHAAIVSAGYRPRLASSTGKMLSFVYDIADLYKVELTVPMAFSVTAELAGSNMESEIRRRCRDAFHEGRLMQRIVPDIDRVLSVIDPATDDAGLRRR
jgi:CRISPR-associated protein Cas1